MSNNRDLNSIDPPQEELTELRNLYGQNSLQQVFHKAKLLFNHYNKSLTLCNLMGASAAQTGQLDEAILAFKSAIIIKPDYAEAHYNMAKVLREQGSLEEAIKAYNKALSIKPDYAKAHNNIGNILKDQGKLEEAIEAYNKALSIEPDYVDALNNMGVALQDQGKLEEAMMAYNKALSTKPKKSFARTNLAMLLFQSRRFEEAAKVFGMDKSINSERYLLKCFYELNKRSEFYKQLDYLIKSGENNCVIGSYVSRSNARYGNSRKNPFCNDPLRYVKKTDLTKNYDFKKIFVENAYNVLTHQQVCHKAQGRLTNGIQTSGNIFTQIGPLSSLWQDIIKSELTSYKDKFCASDEGFIRDWPSDYSLYGWLVSMKSGGELSAHIHDPGWVTGSIYINVPPKFREDSGNLVVTTSDEEHEKENKKETKSIDVVTGSLCLFPSSLLHYTVPFESDDNRVVLAFDMIPNK